MINLLKFNKEYYNNIIDGIKTQTLRTSNKRLQVDEIVKAIFPGTELECSGIFVALGSAGAADFAKKLGLLLDGDSIKVDDKMQTNAPGVYSAGNATGGLLQVCKAVYEGGVAGLSAVNYVRELKKA